jgi:NAD(P)H-hydrate repair Nnr-like enzyme with NAD(P)H-hydrate epimerase domain
VSLFSVPVSEENSQYSVFAGEGSMGGDGIVFVMNKDENMPLWFLFLDNSDPFEKI